MDTNTETTPVTVTPVSPAVAAAKFRGDPAAVQLPFQKKIAAYVNGKQNLSASDRQSVEDWGAAHAAVYGS